MRAPPSSELLLLPLESVARVEGVVRRRPAGRENAAMATGMVEVELTQVTPDT